MSARDVVVERGVQGTGREEEGDDDDDGLFGPRANHQIIVYGASDQDRLLVSRHFRLALLRLATADETVLVRHAVAIA